MPNQFNNALNEINKFITLEDTDRCSYAIDFNAVCSFFTTELCAIDSVFEQLFCGAHLSGSYADHVKISKPDEYDVYLALELRNFDRAIIRPDPKIPGYVRINITEILDTICGEIHNHDIYDRLLKFVDRDDFLVQNKISSWFESMITRILNNYDNRFNEDNRLYYLNYKKTGPAHTITVNQNGRKIDIDFVPAFRFSTNQWFAERPCPAWVKSQYWMAIPKPIKKPIFYRYQQYHNIINNSNEHGRYRSKKANISFRTAYIEIERELINSRNNLKNTLKMIKKLRDCQNITNLKSYYIKTAFLWENESKPRNFWNKPPGEILIYMCDRLVNYFKNRYLPFYWDTSDNILTALTKSQISSIHDQLKTISNKLKKYQDMDPIPNKFLKLFLTRREIRILDNDGTIIDAMERKYNSNSY